MMKRKPPGGHCAEGEMEGGDAFGLEKMGLLSELDVSQRRSWGERRKSCLLESQGPTAARGESARDATGFPSRPATVL